MKTNTENRMKQDVKTPESGMRCPNRACRSRRSKVLRSRLIKDGKVRLRSRQCELCGMSWDTQEA